MIINKLMLTSNSVDTGSITNYSDFLEWSKQYPVVHEHPFYVGFPGYGRRLSYKCNNSVGSMWGSSYGQVFTLDSRYEQICQHAFPVESLYRDAIANNRPSILTIVSNGSGPFSSLTRNGYTSSGFGTYSAGYCPEFIFWNEQLKVAQTCNPFSMSVPTNFYKT